MNKVVPLSVESLAIVYDWCEENEGSPLSEQYFSMCVVIGCGDEFECADQLAASYKRPPFVRLVRKVREARDYAFSARDSLGREILGVIRRTGWEPAPETQPVDDDPIPEKLKEWHDKKAKFLAGLQNDPKGRR